MILSVNNKATIVKDVADIEIIAWQIVEALKFFLPPNSDL